MNKFKQYSSKVLMVSPDYFASNLEAVDNLFTDNQYTKDKVKERACIEFDDLQKKLKDNQIWVVAFKTDHPDLVDAVFPNNWFSTHLEEQLLVLYPLKLKNRRSERNPQIIQYLKSLYPNCLDLSFYEENKDPSFLESTGSLILDRVRKKAYCALSPRSSKSLAQLWAQKMDYELFTFNTGNGTPIYHTNVMLSLGSKVAIVCQDAVTEDLFKKKFLDQLQSTYQQVVNLSLDQMHNFCGNVLFLKSSSNRVLFLISERAYQSLNSEQLTQIATEANDMLICPIETIEKVGGGGVRCMLAELF